jgi:hypothetical protein
MTTETGGGVAASAGRGGDEGRAFAGPAGRGTAGERGQHGDTDFTVADEVDDERTIDELITIAEEAPERVGLAARLAEVRGSARSEGLAVSVDTQGMLVDLEVDDRALAAGSDRLAAEITRLAAEAGTHALREALDVIRFGSNPRLAAALGEHLGIGDEPVTRPVMVEPDGPALDDEDNEGGAGILVRAVDDPPTAVPSPPRRPARKASGDESDEDDTFGGSILVRGD